LIVETCSLWLSNERIKVLSRERIDGTDFYKIENLLLCADVWTTKWNI
jgi:hypothetical protein